eukprot:112002_1
MTWQAKESNRQRSQSTCSQTTFINALTNTLKQYDKDNDGYINWDEFCDMAHDKQYNNYERDQLWIQLGAGKMPTKNSYVRKIPIQPIMQSLPTKLNQKQKEKKKIIRGNYVHVNTYIESKHDTSCEFIVPQSTTPQGYQSYHTIPDYDTNADSAKNKGYYSDERIQRAYTSEQSMKAKDYDLRYANMSHKINNSDDIKDKADNKQEEKKDEKRGHININNINNINNNINIGVGKGVYGSYGTTYDRHDVCWEFNTFVGCRKGSKCKWQHKYLLKDAINPYTGEKLSG